jgi:hypothetical protein
MKQSEMSGQHIYKQISELLKEQSELSSAMDELDDRYSKAHEVLSKEYKRVTEDLGTLSNRRYIAVP